MEQIIQIRGGGYAANINLSRGANCISLTHETHRAAILREPDYEKELDNPYLYGMPLLFPANRISGGRFYFEGREYCFPINEPATGCHLHGIMHTLPFSLMEQSADSVRCVWDAPHPDIPFRFRMEILYHLSGEGLTQSTRITNFSSYTIPILLAYHTTFRLPFLTGSKPGNVRIFAEVSEEIVRSPENYLPTGAVLPQSETAIALCAGTFSPTQQKISKHYRAANQGQIELRDIAHGLKVVYRNSANYPWRLFYNMGTDKFICLEPMTNLVDGPNFPLGADEQGFECLAPNDTKEYISQISLQEVAL